MNDIQRLNAMGITLWDIRRPDVFPDRNHSLEIPSRCRLLLVSPEPPCERDAWLFGKIIASMHLSPGDTLYLPPVAFPHIRSHALTWCWFAGAPTQFIENIHVLHSPALSLMHDDVAAKKALWQQIKSTVASS